MDPVRLLLISSTAVVSLLLLIEWNQYSDSHKKQQSDLYAAAVLETPVTEEKSSFSAIDEGIPSVSAPVAALTETRDQAASFFLNTDAINLAISMDGGDITGASLPKFPVRLDTPDQPFRLLESNALRTYVAQTGLIGPDGIDASGDRARYVSQGIDVGADGSHTLTLAWIGNDPLGLQVFKQITAYDNQYVVDVTFDIRNNSGQSVNVTSFAQLKRDNSEAPDANVGFGVSPYLGAALTQPEERYTKLAFSDLQDEPFSKNLPGGWVAILQHYFVSAWIPSQTESHDFFASQLSNGDNVIGYKNAGVSIDAGDQHTISERLWAGHKRRRVEHGLKGNGFGFSSFNEESPYTSTISARYYKDGSEILIEQDHISKRPNRPRKLHPVEAARLQGYPIDDWYKIPVSDNQAYKQFGNSVSVPVVTTLAKEIVKQLLNA